MKTLFTQDFRLLLQYSLKNKKRRNPANARPRRLSSALSSWLGYLLVPFLFVAVLTPVYVDLFSNVTVPLEKFGWNSPFFVSDVLMAPIFLVTALLFAFQFAPLLVVELFENEMTPLLLTMPIRRSSIFLVSSLNTLLMTSFGIAMTLSVSLAYLLLNRDQFLWGVIGISLWMFFQIALGFLFGFLLAKLIGKTAAKRASQLISFLVLILILMSPSIIAPISGTDPETILRSLRSSAGFFLFPGWPHYWFMAVAKGQSAFLFPLSALTAGLFAFVLFYANTINFTPARKNRERKKIAYDGESAESIKGSAFPLLKKELRLMFRESGIIWYLIYPLAFPILLVFGRYHQLPFVSLLFMIVATMYSGMVSVMMMISEKKIWPAPTLFPISFASLIRIKIWIPVTLYTLEYLILLGIFIALSPSALYDTFMILPIALILYYCSLLGTRLFLNDPNRDISQRNRLLKGSEVLKLEGLSMGFSFGFFGAFFLLKTYLIDGPFWFFTGIRTWSAILVFIGVIMILFGLLFWSILRERRMIRRLLIE